MKLINEMIIGLLVASTLFVQPVVAQEVRDELIKISVLEAEKIARSSPLTEKVKKLCQIAAECERLEHDHSLWPEINDAIDNAEESERDDLRIALCLSLAKASDLSTVMGVVKSFTSNAKKAEGLLQTSNTFAERGETKSAHKLALLIEKRNALRFYAMEAVVLAAGQAGEFQLANTAARGMDPYGDGMMERKLITMCFLTAESHKAGKTEFAKASLKPIKIFAKVQQDATVNIIVELTSAAINADGSFEKLLRKKVDKLNADATNDTSTNTQHAIATLVDTLEMDELAIHLARDYRETKFGSTLGLILASRFAKAVNRESFDSVVADLNGRHLSAFAKILMGSSLGNAGDHAAANEYLKAVEDSISDKEQNFLQHMRLANHAVYGDTAKAWSEIKSLADNEVAFNTHIEILKQF